MFVVYLILGIVSVLFIGGLIFYNWYKLRKDIAIYKKNYEQVIASSGGVINGVDGADGTDGKSALELYNEQQQILDPLFVPITQVAFEALYAGNDGTAGAHAAGGGVDGDHGKDGSEGDIGDVGASGATGAAGEDGVNGISGESFLSVYVSDTPANDVAQLTVNVAPYDPTAPADHPYCEFIYNKVADIPRRLAYYYDGKLLFHLSIANGTPAGSNPDAYISYIVYDNNDIIGLTSPIKITDYDVTQVIATTIVLGSNPNIKLRAILSRNKGLTMASFTQDIYESNLDTEAFVYQRATETDPFITNLYTIIGTTYGTTQTERVKISEKVGAPTLNITLG